MKIAIGSDHVGYPLKRHIIDYLSEKDYECVNFGTGSEQRTDYPIYGKRVADAIISGEYYKGILICGTGIGISLAANKIMKMFSNFVRHIMQCSHRGPDSLQ